MHSHLRLTLCAAALVGAVVVGNVAQASKKPIHPTGGHTTATPSQKPGALVVGGGVVPDMTQNPGAVSLYAPRYGGFSCSAERIGPTWVITARHCAELRPSRVYTNSLRHTTGVYGDVKRIAYAPSGDMALLELASAPAGPIMPWSDVAPAPGEEVRFYGWGMTSASSRSSVLKTGVGRFGRTAPNPFYRGTDLVMSGVDGAPWKGDSGGPVVDKNGRLVGACSWSSSYGTSRTAQFGYTSTAHLSQWIRSTTGIAPGTGGQPQPNPTPTPDPTPSNPTPSPTISDPSPIPSEPSPGNPSPAPSNPSPAPTEGPGISGPSIEVTSSNYDAVLQESSRRPVVFEFGATWCGACQTLKPILARHNAAAQGRWLLATVDVDRNSTLSRKHSARSLPTVVPISNGKEMSSPARFVGAYGDAWVGTWTAQLTK